MSVGGENWETRWVRSRAGLLQSPRDLHLDLATFGARHSLRNSDTLLALLGTALATLEHIPPKEPWNGPVLTTHTVLPGAVNLWVLFPRTYFFLPGAFFRKTFFRRNQVASLS